MASPRLQLALALALVAFTLLTGCGGGGGGSSTPISNTSYGRITGNVQDASGTALTRADGEAVTVTVEGTGLSAQTDADGAFTIEGVPPGLHTLVARTSGRAFAVVVAVDQGKETAVGEVVLRESGLITGSVTSSSTQAPVEQARVTVLEMVTQTAGEMPHPTRSTQTNISGDYSIPGLPAGSYNVTVTKDGFQPQSFAVTVSVGGTANTDTALDPVAPSSQNGSMAGTVRVVADSGTEPVAGVLVRLARQNDADINSPIPASGDQPPAPRASRTRVDTPPPPPFGGPEYYTFTEDDGTYRLTDIPAGQYVAVAVRPGLNAVHQSVTIAAGATLTVDFTLTMATPRPGVIEGTITDSITGAPVNHAKVTAVIGASPGSQSTRQSSGSPRGAVISSNPSSTIMQTHTDASGHYMLRVPESVTAIAIRQQGYSESVESVSVTPGGSTTASATIAPDQLPEFTLSGRVTHTLSGVSYGTNNATVYASASGSDPITATTDTDGNYEMRLPWGTYLVHAQRADMVSDTVSIVVSRNTTQNFSVATESAPPPPAFSRAH